MAKTYTVDSEVGPMIGMHRAAAADWIPNQNQWALRGPRLMLNAVGGDGVRVVGAGNSASIDFQTHDFIDTIGLANCFAVCAVWNKVGDAFQDGFLAHVSSPHGATFNTAIANIPGGAWIVVGVGTGGWGALIAQKLVQAGHAADHVWIYTRQLNAVGFGIEKHGRFGEI